MYAALSAAVTTVMFCCTNHFNATCAGDTLCAFPMAMTVGSLNTSVPVKPPSGEYAEYLNEKWKNERN